MDRTVGGNDRGEAMVFFGREPDVEVGAQRSGDLVTKERSDAAPDGAEVYVDGELVGQVPLEPIDAVPGSHHNGPSANSRVTLSQS